MYKALIVVLIAIVGITYGSNFNTQQLKIQRAKSIFPNPNAPGNSFCKICIDVADQSINILLNLILDTGIIGSCETLCQALAQKTGSQLIGVICNVACDAFGIIEFIKILEKADI